MALFKFRYLLIKISSEREMLFSSKEEWLLRIGIGEVRYRLRKKAISHKSLRLKFGDNPCQKVMQSLHEQDTSLDEKTIADFGRQRSSNFNGYLMCDSTMDDRADLKAYETKCVKLSLSTAKETISRPERHPELLSSVPKAA